MQCHPQRAERLYWRLTFLSADRSDTRDAVGIGNHGEVYFGGIGQIFLRRKSITAERSELRSL